MVIDPPGATLDVSADGVRSLKFVALFNDADITSRANVDDQQRGPWVP